MRFFRTPRKTPHHITKIPEALTKATVETPPGFGAAIFTQVIVKELFEIECVETETVAFTFRKTSQQKSLSLERKDRERHLSYACWLFNGYNTLYQDDNAMREEILRKLRGVLTDLFGRYDRVDVRFVRNGTMITVVEAIDRETGKQLVCIDKPI